MKKTSKIIVFILSAALICAALCGCGAAEIAPVQPSSAPAEAEAKAAPLEWRYEADISVLSQAGPHLAARAFTEDGFYAVDYGIRDEALGDYVTGVFHISYDGELTTLEKYVPVQPDEELLSLPEFYSTHELEGFALDEDGNIITVESLYMSWYAGPGQRRAEYASMYDAYEYASYIRLLDKDGAELSRARLPLSGDENIYAYELKVDELGNLVFSSGNSLCFYSVEGEEKGRLELPGFVRSILQGSKGDIAAVCYQEDGTELLCRISPEDMRIASRHSIPAGMMLLCLGDEENEFHYSDGQNFYAYDLSTGNSRRLFNWLSCGIDAGSLSNVQLLPGDIIRAVSNEYSDKDESNTTELVGVGLKPVYAGEEKAVLTLGCLEADSDLVNALKDFNRSSEKSYIELREYYREYDFLEAGQEQRLVNSLVAGDIPDILILDGLNHRLLAARGLLADISTYLDADAVLSRDDFFENVLASCEKDGRLYALADGFSVDTVMADAATAGDEPGWSYEQYNEALASMPAGCHPFERHITCEEILRSLLSLELDSYIDYGSLSADFTNDSFIGLLRFSSGFPRSFDWDNYEWTDADITEYRINGGRQMLMRTTLLSMEEVYFNSIYFNGNGSYKGYPSADGSVGSAMTLHRLCAVGAESEHKDEAWRFISGLISDDSHSSWGFPALKSRFLESMEQFSEPQYMSDEEDRPILTEDGEPIELAQGHMGTVLGVRGFYALSDVNRERFEKALGSCTKLKCEDNQLTEFIIEALDPWFEGRMDAETAAVQVETQVSNWLSQYK